MGKRRGFLSQAAAALTLAVLLIAAVGCSSSSKSASTASQAAADMAAPAAKQQDAAAKQAAPASGAAEKVQTTASNAAAAGGDKPAAADKTAAAPQGPAGFVQGDASDGLNRKLIYKANLTMEVADYGKAQTQIRDLVQLKGAYILQFTENQTSNEQSGNFAIKVPASGFSALLGDLDKIETLKTQRNLQGQDVSEEYVDLESRLKAKQVAESRMLSFMEKAEKTDDLVAFSNELGKVQQEIEQIKGRMRYLDQNVAMSTIEIRLYQKIGIASAKKGTAPEASLGSRTYAALADSFSLTGVVLSKLVVFLAGALPVFIALAVVIVPAVYVNRKRKRKESGIQKAAE